MTQLLIYGRQISFYLPTLSTSAASTLKKLIFTINWKIVASLNEEWAVYKEVISMTKNPVADESV